MNPDDGAMYECSVCGRKFAVRASFGPPNYCPYCGHGGGE